MKISRIDNSYNFNFNKKFKTEDVLKTLTAFDFKMKNADEFIKEISGTELTQESLQDIFNKKYNPNLAKITVKDLCAEEMMKQDERLKEVQASYDKFLTESGPMGFERKRYSSWFDEQMKKLGKTIDLEPFVINKEEIQNKYESLFNLFQTL